MDYFSRELGEALFGDRLLPHRRLLLIKTSHSEFPSQRFLSCSDCRKHFSVVLTKKRAFKEKCLFQASYFSNLNIKYFALQLSYRRAAGRSLQSCQLVFLLGVHMSEDVGREGGILPSQQPPRPSPRLISIKLRRCASAADASSSEQRFTARAVGFVQLPVHSFSPEPRITRGFECVWGVWGGLPNSLSSGS